MKKNQTMAPVTLSELSERYDGFLVDQYGVLVDSEGAYSGASEALHRLSNQKNRVFILTNSGKRAVRTYRRLERLGFDSSDYSGVISSGEVARRMFVERFGVGDTDGDTDSSQPATSVWYLAEDSEDSPLESLNVRLSDTPASSDFLVFAGVPHTAPPLDEYKNLLAPAASAGIPAVCTNPDFEQLVADGLLYAAGAVARAYAELGGEVEWIGKPHRAVYDYALDCLDGIPPNKIVCIGDSPAHDILGGRNAGFGTALVRTGIHSGLDSDSLNELCEGEGAEPDYILESFTWT